MTLGGFRTCTTCDCIKPINNEDPILIVSLTKWCYLSTLCWLAVMNTLEKNCNFLWTNSSKNSQISLEKCFRWISDKFSISNKTLDGNLFWQIKFHHKNFSTNFSSRMFINSSFWKKFLAGHIARKFKLAWSTEKFSRGASSPEIFRLILLPKISSNIWYRCYQ